MIAMLIQSIHFIKKKDKNLLDSIILSGGSVAFAVNLVAILLFIINY